MLQHSIKQRLIIIILTVSAVSLISISLGIGYLDIRNLQQDLAEDAELHTRFTGQNCIGPLDFRDKNGAHDILNNLEAVSYVRAAYLYDADNELFASYRAVGETEDPPQHALKKPHNNGHLHIIEPIIYDGTPIGTIHLKASRQQLNKAITTYLYTMAIIIVLIMILAFILANRLQRLISEPLLHLAKTTRHISDAADYSIRVTRQSDDEIGILYDGFNEMLNQIQHRENQRNHAEEALRQTKNYLDNILNSMPSMLIGVDKAGQITQWNREAVSRTGLEAERVLGRSLDSILPELHQEMENIFKAIKTKTTLKDSKRSKTQNGTQIYEDMTVYPLITNGVEGAVIRIDNITERVRMEEMMIQSEKMLSVGGLAAGMAHEINNPLAGILQNIQVISNRLLISLPKNTQAAMETGLNQDALHAYLDKRGIPNMLEAVLQSGQRAAKIVDNMLSFSRKSDSSMAMFDLAYLIDQTIELAENDYDLKKKYDFRRIKIDRHFQNEMPHVKCVPSQIQQVLLNILKNGAQAMAEGTQNNEPPCFTIRIYANNGLAYIGISDNGPGMDEASQRRVFEPFYTTKSVGVGTGLGLSVSYFIITENHGGNMSVKSALDKGTEFSIYLPLDN